MDERFRGKGIWVGLGALAIVFLCLTLCGLVSMLVVPRGMVYAPPPSGQEGAAPPPTTYGYGPVGMGHYGGGGPLAFLFYGIGAIFRLAFLGLLLLLLLGLVKRVLWGHRHWGQAYRCRPAEGEEGEGKPYPGWGPWAWHHHGKRGGPPHWWGPPPEPADRGEESGESYAEEE
jgi:hypothetical protein